MDHDYTPKSHVIVIYPEGGSLCEVVGYLRGEAKQKVLRDTELPASSRSLLLPGHEMIVFSLSHAFDVVCKTGWK